MVKKIFNFMLAGSLAVAGLTSCSSDEPDGSNKIYEALGIPSDNEATDAPVIDEPTISLPNATLTLKEQDGYEYVQVDMTGIFDINTDSYLKLAGTRSQAQNIWITVDDEAKGIDVYNVEDDKSKVLLVDVVFLVDNSGSMSEEANQVARSIIDWSTKLSEDNLDIRVGCVGYGDSYHAIDGALNMTTTEELYDYLNRASGIYRTQGYGGEDASTLRDLAENSGKYENGSYNECGMVALRFAHDNFNFRMGANRVYINFTDEPNQPYGLEAWSVEYLNPEFANWKSSFGTIHTVFSASRFSYNNYLYSEQPWLMSEYTGGTYIFVSNYATDWDLTSLPVTGAMQHSSLIRFTNLDSLKDGKAHQVRITVQSVDNNVRGEKIINYNFSEGREE